MRFEDDLSGCVDPTFPLQALQEDLVPVRAEIR